ncbi:MAG: Sb-PDE family phosphodiesterase [Bacteroidia bacterium]|nr:Sb-PDE family phosphodiesterase [Bacteroidia bacterium]
MKRLIIIALLFISISIFVNGQRKTVHLPDLPGYVTLKCDFHMHTVFSDGDVWPTVRVDEALRDGLDAIAITDHLEYTPKEDFIPVDYNAAWKIAEEYAKERNLILVHGAEITRKMPPGHFNALFITDASLIEKDSIWDSFEAAIKQGAFLQWDHPGWKAQQPDGIPRMYEIHQRLIKNGWLHGIEFFNDYDYYPLVFTFCKQYNLALMGNSDVHGSISENYSDPDNTNRPMTLVFAKERSHDSLKEALFAGRTMVYFRDMLAGKEEFAKLFFYQCISIGKPYYQNDKSLFFEVTNRSDIPFYLINGIPDAPAFVNLAANSVTRIVVSKKVASPLVYYVRNVLTGENEVLKVELKY